MRTTLPISGHRRLLEARSLATVCQWDAAAPLPQQPTPLPLTGTLPDAVVQPGGPRRQPTTMPSSPCHSSRRLDPAPGRGDDPRDRRPQFQPLDYGVVMEASPGAGHGLEHQRRSLRGPLRARHRHRLSPLTPATPHTTATLSDPHRRRVLLDDPAPLSGAGQSQRHALWNASRPVRSSPLGDRRTPTRGATLFATPRRGARARGRSIPPPVARPIRGVSAWPRARWQRQSRAAAAAVSRAEPGGHSSQALVSPAGSSAAWGRMGCLTQLSRRLRFPERSRPRCRDLLRWRHRTERFSTR